MLIILPLSACDNEWCCGLGKDTNEIGPEGAFITSLQLPVIEPTPSIGIEDGLASGH